jgi:hypothetical protein
MRSPWQGALNLFLLIYLLILVNTQRLFRLKIIAERRNTFLYPTEEELVGNAHYYREAAELLRTEGWMKKKWSSPEGRCLVQAISDVAEITFGEEIHLPLLMEAELRSELIRYPDFARALKKAQRREESFTWAVVFWNDRSRRKPGEVIGMLESLADRLELEEEAISLRDEVELVGA